MEHTGFYSCKIKFSKEGNQERSVIAAYYLIIVSRLMKGSSVLFTGDSEGTASVPVGI